MTLMLFNVKMQNIQAFGTNSWRTSDRGLFNWIHILHLSNAFWLLCTVRVLWLPLLMPTLHAPKTASTQNKTDFLVFFLVATFCSGSYCKLPTVSPPPKQSIRHCDQKILLSSTCWISTSLSGCFRNQQVQIQKCLPCKQRNCQHNLTRICFRFARPRCFHDLLIIGILSKFLLFHSPTNKNSG